MREAVPAKIALVGVWLCGVIVAACGGPDRPPTCRDGVRNGRETDVDCGGRCIPCTPQQRCHTGQDCTSGRCTSGTCAAPTCTDGIANGTELGVDCGGSCAAACGKSCATSPLCVIGFIPIDEGDNHLRLSYLHSWGSIFDVVADRTTYFAGDTLAHVIIESYQQDWDRPDRALAVELRRAGEAQPLATDTRAPLASPKLEVRVDLAALPAGTYEIAARLSQVTPAGTVELAKDSLSFTKQASLEPAAPFPESGVEVVVPAQGELPDLAWGMTTGIPLPRGAVHDLGRLALYENGVEVPAQLAPRAHWHVGGSIKWLGLDFTARWDRGVPRKYRLVRRAAVPRSAGVPQAATPRLEVSTTAASITLTTGPARFEIARRGFAGISRAWLDRNGDHQFTDDERVIDGAGGPFVVDQDGTRFAAVHDATATVELEESGPERATVVARGWLDNGAGGRLNRFVTRLVAFAGESRLRIKHQTIATYDTRTATRLADVGFDIVSADEPVGYRFGTAEGILRGAAPAPGRSVYLHQDRSDHYRLRQGGEVDVPIAEGTRADGWVELGGKRSGLFVALRDAYQRFPKELEITNESDALTVPVMRWSPRVAVHLWPKHGRDTFSDAEELARNQIYKMRWAHEGRLLDFNVPAKYLDELTRLHDNPDAANPDRGWDAEGQRDAARISNAQGVAITAEIAVVLQPAGAPDGRLWATGRLIQRAPHVMSPAAWNTSTGVEESLAEQDPVQFPVTEHSIALSYPGYQRYIVDAGDGYGMWIWANQHNSWDPSRRVPSLHRLWQQSHYRNVYAAWLLYFRSGDPEMLAWARANSAFYLDTGIVHHDKVGSSPHNGSIEGSLYHCKGFVPWGSGEVVPGAHWTDATSFMLEYYLTGDGHARDAFELWYAAQRRTGTYGNDPPPGQPCSSFAGVDYLRNYVTPYGEIIRYYQTTHDAQALLLLHEFRRTVLGMPWECTGFPPHALFASHWMQRDWQMRRDPQLISRLQALLASGTTSFTAAALLYEATGDTSELLKALPSFHDQSALIYENPGDKLHGYSDVTISSTSIWLHEAPYFLWALRASGTPFGPGARRMSYPEGGGGYNWGTWRTPPRGWSNAGLYVGVLPPAGSTLELGLDHRFSVVDPMIASYYLYAPPPRAPPSDWLPHGSIPVPLVQGQFQYASTFPVPVSYANTLAEPYHLECFGSCALFAPLGRGVAGAPRPAEAAVMRSTLFLNPGEMPLSSVLLERSDFFLQTLGGRSIELEITASRGRYDIYPESATPSGVRVTDANGETLLDTSLFYFGDRPRARLSLDPARHPPPWHWHSLSRYGPVVRIVAGADELLWALTPEDLAALSARIVP
jgi:hypothetical protein